jgi:hypothetical protein
VQSSTAAPTETAPAAAASATTEEPATADDAPVEKAEPTSSADVEADSEVGVPQSSNSFLPFFGNDYGEPFFERQGLRFRIGPVRLRATLLLGTEYTDNVNASNVDPQSDIITTVSPTFLVGVGDFDAKLEDFLFLTYQPSLQYFLHNPDSNAVNQGLVAGGKIAFSRFSTRLDLTYSKSDVPNAVQTGRQNYEVLNAVSENTYFLTEKVFARLNLNLLTQSYETGEKYETYVVNPLLGYTLSEKTTFFFGPSAGISYIGSSDNSSSSTQTFQGFSAGMIYTYSPKLQAQGNFGVQSRQYNGDNVTGATNFTTPVFSFALTYTATEKTSASLTLGRDVQLSDVLQGQTYTNSQIALNLAHQFTSSLSASVDIGYQNLLYQGSVSNDREDNYAFFSPQITYAFFSGRCRISTYYRRQQRTSSVQTFDYTVNAYGLQLSYDF